MKHGYRQRIPVPHKIQYYIIFLCILASVTDGHKDSVLDVVTYYNKWKQVFNQHPYPIYSR